MKTYSQSITTTAAYVEFLPVAQRTGTARLLLSNPSDSTTIYIGTGTFNGATAVAPTNPTLTASSSTGFALRPGKTIMHDYNRYESLWAIASATTNLNIGYTLI